MSVLICSHLKLNPKIMGFVNELCCCFSLQELSYREFESACDQSKRCEHLSRIARIRCVRECISPSCYQEIYEFDEVKTKFPFSPKILAKNHLFILSVGRG